MNVFPPRRSSVAFAVLAATFALTLTPALGAEKAPAAAPKTDAAAPAATPAAPDAAPPPRHGARQKAADGTTVAYNAVGGVFVAADRPDTFWVAPRFYHFDHGVWTSATAVAGPWELSSSKDIPPQVLGAVHVKLKTEVTATLPAGGEAVYDPTLKAFKVSAHRGVFLVDGQFYRYDTGLWLGSKSVDGPWTVTSPKGLPLLLRKALPLPNEGQTVKLPSGETVVWDARAKVFTMQSEAETAFFEGGFYRRSEGKWLSAKALAGPFVEVDAVQVPAPVRFKFGKGKAGGAAGKGNAGGAKAGGGAKPGAGARHGKP